MKRSKLSKDKVLLLHQYIASETGGSVGLRDEEIVRVGLSLAECSMGYDELLAWIREHAMPQDKVK